MSEAKRAGSALGLDARGPIGHGACSENSPLGTRGEGAQRVTWHTDSATYVAPRELREAAESSRAADLARLCFPPARP